MPRPPAEPDAILDRRNKVWDLRVKGYTVREIAKEVGVSSATVHSDIEAVRLETADTTKENALKQRAIEIDRIDGWIRDGNRRLAGAKDGTASLLLNSLRGLSERRAKLLGLDAPTEVVSTNTNESIEATPERARQLMAEKFGRVSITDVGTGANPVPADDPEPTSSSG